LMLCLSLQWVAVAATPALCTVAMVYCSRCSGQPSSSRMSLQIKQVPHLLDFLIWFCAAARYPAWQQQLMLHCDALRCHVSGKLTGCPLNKLVVCCVHPMKWHVHVGEASLVPEVCAVAAGVPVSLQAGPLALVILYHWLQS
jgi:hypothetical protein